MVFKLSPLLQVIAAAALIFASPIAKRGTAQCTYVVTPSGVPDTSSVELTTEWNYLIGRNFAASFQACPVFYVDQGTNSSVAGPDPVTKAYTVVKGVGAFTVSDDEAVAVVTAWAGSTFDGPWTGVEWKIESVSC